MIALNGIRIQNGGDTYELNGGGGGIDTSNLATKDELNALKEKISGLEEGSGSYTIWWGSTKLKYGELTQEMILNSFNGVSSEAIIHRKNVNAPQGFYDFSEDVGAYYRFIAVPKVLNVRGTNVNVRGMPMASHQGEITLDGVLCDYWHSANSLAGADEFEIDGGSAGGASGNNDELLAKIQALESELTALKEQVASLDISNVVKRDEIEEFDANAYKADLQTIFDNATAVAQNDLVTSGQVEEFDLQAYHTQLQSDVAEAKKDLITSGEVEEFDAQALKDEIKGMIG